MSRLVRLVLITTVLATGALATGVLATGCNSEDAASTLDIPDSTGDELRRIDAIIAQLDSDVQDAAKAADIQSVYDALETTMTDADVQTLVLEWSAAVATFETSGVYQPSSDYQQLLQKLSSIPYLDELTAGAQQKKHVLVGLVIHYPEFDCDIPCAAQVVPWAMQELALQASLTALDLFLKGIFATAVSAYHSGELIAECMPPAGPECTFYNVTVTFQDLAGNLALSLIDATVGAPVKVIVSVLSLLKMLATFGTDLYAAFQVCGHHQETQCGSPSDCYQELAACASAYNDAFGSCDAMSPGYLECSCAAGLAYLTCIEDHDCDQLCSSGEMQCAYNRATYEAACSQ